MVFTVCHSICTFLTNFSRETLFGLNFRVIAANMLGVRKFMTFMVSADAKPELVMDVCYLQGLQDTFIAMHAKIFVLQKCTSSIFWL